MNTETYFVSDCCGDEVEAKNEDYEIKYICQNCKETCTVGKSFRCESCEDTGVVYSLDGQDMYPCHHVVEEMADRDNDNRLMSLLGK